MAWLEGEEEDLHHCIDSLGTISLEFWRGSPYSLLLTTKTVNFVVTKEESSTSILHEYVFKSVHGKSHRKVT